MERFLSLSSLYRYSRKMPNWIIYFFAVPNEINSVAPEWVDLAKNVNQGSGSQVITLRSDWGGGEGRGGGLFQGAMLSAPGLPLHSNYQPTHPWISLQFMLLWHPGPVWIWGWRPITPDEWVWTMWPCSPPSKPEMIGPEVLTQKQ